MSTPPCLPQLRSSSSMHSRQPSPGISAYFQFKFTRQFPTDSSPYSALRSPNFTTCLPHTGKILPYTLVSLHRNNSQLCFGHHMASTIVLGAARCSTTPQTLYSSTASHRECPRWASGIVTTLFQSSGHGKTVSNEEESREGQSGSLVLVLGVHFGS